MSAGKAGAVIFTACVLHWAGHVLSEGTNITKLDGESVTLYMNRSMVPLNNFLWTFGHHNPTVAITIVTNGKVTQVNGTRFENRLQTDAETGSITISNLTVNDSGVFLAQILTPSGILLQNFSLTVKDNRLIPVYVLEGTNVTLDPGIKLQKDYVVKWTKGPDFVGTLIARWTNSETFIDKSFEGVLELNPETGSITLHSMNENYAGIYCVVMELRWEIHIRRQYLITVVEPVLMPIISEAEGKVTPSSETRHNQDKCLISCSVKNGPCLSLTWYRGEKEVNHTTDTDTSNLTLPLEITSQDQMNFSCVAANPLIRKAVTINSTLWCAPQPQGSVVIIQLLSVTMAGTARKPQTKDEINDDMTGRNEEEGGDSKTKSTEGGSTEEQLRYAKHVIRHQSASSGRRDDEDLLPHTKSSQDTVEEMKSYLRTFNAGNISQERCMNLFICKFELSEERFQDDIKLYLDSGVRLSSIDCSVLSTLLQLSGEVIDDLDLTKCYTPLHGTEKLIQLLKKCKRGALKSQHLSAMTRGLHILVSILYSADSCLQDLGLVCVQNENVSLPYDLLVVLGDSKLETLRLSGYTLDFQRCHLLASILQFKHSSLKALDLKDCIYSYPQDYSGYKPEEMEKTQEYEDFYDELTLLTVIPAALIGPIGHLEEFRFLI
ncbi:uncharacterized protein V6R79_004221 [Siganus canaliculatus]